MSHESEVEAGVSERETTMPVSLSPGFQRSTSLTTALSRLPRRSVLSNQQGSISDPRRRLRHDFYWERTRSPLLAMRRALLPKALQARRYDQSASGPQALSIEVLS